MTVSSHELEKKIYDNFSDVLDWHYNNKNKDSVVIIFKDGSEAVYTVDKIMKDQVNDNKKSESRSLKKKVNIFEALTEQDIEDLSEFSLTESDIQHILSLFELISEENKDKAFAIIKNLFKGKKLVPDEEVKEKLKKTRSSVSERYTKKLLGDI